jgi:hypothetical protein
MLLKFSGSFKSHQSAGNSASRCKGCSTDGGARLPHVKGEAFCPPMKARIHRQTSPLTVHDGRGNQNAVVAMGINNGNDLDTGSWIK